MLSNNFVVVVVVVVCLRSRKKEKIEKKRASLKFSRFAAHCADPCGIHFNEREREREIWDFQSAIFRVRDCVDVCKRERDVIVVDE